MPAPSVEVREKRITSREQEILALAERGHANKIIAEATGVAFSTVSTLLTRARRKSSTAR
ncbi:MAG: LuxR C-terminal-related transcriptional regulator [Verrucomicrobiota bacterium]